MSTLTLDSLKQVLEKYGCGEKPYSMSIAGALGMSGLSGLVIRENAFMLEPGPERMEDRSWGERLLSWPWKPWQKQKVVRDMVPSKQVFLLDNRVLLMHPQTARELRNHIAGELCYELKRADNGWRSRYVV